MAFPNFVAKILPRRVRQGDVTTPWLILREVAYPPKTFSTSFSIQPIEL